uniref:Deoxyhypusine synthase n=1 Tax=Scleropages formosus TaxID=113540 RepID=A0A8C9SWH7_SCLFO
MLFFKATSNKLCSVISPYTLFTKVIYTVDVIVTTAGRVEEDLIECLAPTFLGQFSLLIVLNDNYCKFEDWLMPILDQMVLEQNTEGTRWTPSKMIHRLGKEVNSPDFVLLNDIPVFCPALPHASLGDVIYVRSYKNPARVLDISECERQKRECFSPSL